MKLSELRKIFKDNNFKGYKYYNKEGLTKFLEGKGLLPNEPTKVPNFEYLKKIRKQPKKVEITDTETNNITVFPSIYKAAKHLLLNPGKIKYHNGKVYQNKYAINILD